MPDLFFVILILNGKIIIIVEWEKRRSQSLKVVKYVELLSVSLIIECFIEILLY